MRRSRRLLCTCVLGLLIVVPLGATGRSAARPAQPSCSVLAQGWTGSVTGNRIGSTHQALERRVVRLLNRFRKANGWRALRLGTGLPC